MRVLSQKTAFIVLATDELKQAEPRDILWESYSAGL